MNIEQFEILLNEVKNSYEKSGLADKGLYYSLVGTRIKLNQPLIVGLNWGGGGEGDESIYRPQTVESYKKYIDDDTHFFSEGLDAGSIVRIKPYLEKYAKVNMNNAHVGWTNFCFFRTPDDSTLTDEAVKLSNPIFSKLIETIKPSMIIGLSSQLRDYFKEQNMLEQIQEYTAQDENCILWF